MGSMDRLVSYRISLLNDPSRMIYYYTATHLRFSEPMPGQLHNPQSYRFQSSSRSRKIQLAQVPHFRYAWLHVPVPDPLNRTPSAASNQRAPGVIKNHVNSARSRWKGEQFFLWEKHSEICACFTASERLAGCCTAATIAVQTAGAAAAAKPTLGRAAAVLRRRRFLRARETAHEKRDDVIH